MTIEIERRGVIAVLALNREAVLNALNGLVITTLHASVRELAQDTEIRAVIMTGRGRSFCVGLDHKEYADGLSPAAAYDLIRTLTALQDDIEALPVPIIAAIAVDGSTPAKRIVPACSPGSSLDITHFKSAKRLLPLLPPTHPWGYAQPRERSR